MVTHVQAFMTLPHIKMAQCHGVNLSRTNHHVSRDEFKKLRPDWQCKKCAKALAAREEWEARKVQQEGHMANYSSYKVDDLARRVNRELPHICPPSDFGEIAVSAHLGDRRDQFAVAVQFAPADEYDLSPDDFHEIKMKTMLQREFVKVFSEYGDDITKVEVSWGENGDNLVAYIEDNRPGTQSESVEVRHPMRQLVEGLGQLNESDDHPDYWHGQIKHHLSPEHATVDGLNQLHHGLSSSKMSKEGWHALANKQGMSVAKSATASYAKDRVIRRVESLRTTLHKIKAQGGRGAA